MSVSTTVDESSLLIPCSSFSAERTSHQKDVVCGSQSHVSNRLLVWDGFRQQLFKVIVQYQFPLMIFAAIWVARLYPPLGADYLQAEITANWVAVGIIFVLSGMGLKTEEFSKAFQRLKFNCFVQVFNFLVISVLAFILSRALDTYHLLDRPLADGMVICACLPMAINVVIVLTSAAGGDEAASVFNATFGNMLGIFLSPILIMFFLGSSADISLAGIFFNLVLRVVVPLVVGQLLQTFSVTARNVYAQRRALLKKVPEFCLVYIVYTVFCRMFDNGIKAKVEDILLVGAAQLFLMLAMMTLAWFSLRFLFPNEPELRVMGLFGCVYKTMALGVPLIASIYGKDVNVGLYTLPLLIWHPMQLVVGSLLAPRLLVFVHEERKRLSQGENGISEYEALPMEYAR